MKRQAPTLTSPIESPKFEWLDKLADPVQRAAHSVFRAGAAGREAKRWLNGTPQRHRVHPAIIIWPLGAWTTAGLLDALDVVASRRGRDGYGASADASVAFGLVGAIPTVAAGLADWVDTYDHHRRVGMAHALSNSLAIGLYGASLAMRLAGKRGAGRALGVAGLGAVTLGGALGGDLTYNLGVNVPYLLYPKPPEGWTEALSSAELPEGRPVVVEVGRVPVMLLRQDGTIAAVQSWCPHAGGPLEEGSFEDGCVECPWHGSRFELDSGRPVVGPASSPLRTFEVREEGGRVSVRPSYEGQDWPPPPKPPAQAPNMAQA
jgi:nitrite reductase/ring-hydroxylating ferredoxin subunit/uncharacterized membrane protein